ncbi:hypothetical protein ACFSUK_26730 [Sphingobium scionense]
MGRWPARLPLTDGVFTYKPRYRILVDVSSTMGSRYSGRNTTTTGMRALRLGLEGGVGPHFFYQFESDFSENEVDIVTAFLGYRNRISSKVDYDVRAGHLFNDRAFEGSTGSDSTPSWNAAPYRPRSFRSAASMASASWAACSARTGTHRSA